MKELNLTKEVFSIPFGDKYVIYAPLKQLAMLVGGKVVNLLNRLAQKNSRESFSPDEYKILKTFNQLGLLEADSGQSFQHASVDHYAPTYVTLFLTTQCNLRCTYCYASGGEKPPVTLPLDMGKVAIDCVIQNAQTKKQNYFEVGFHGGGEPTTAWSTLVSLVNYANKRSGETGLGVNINIATNGVLTRRKLDWILSNCTGISLSLDGPKDIQDAQRPLASGQGSFEKVMATIKRMDEENFSYGIRATVTDKSVDRMAELVHLIGRNHKPRQIHFEPTFECGRCVFTNSSAPTPEKFIQGYRAACQTAAQYGLRIVYSGARADTVTERFCQASGGSFCVTPEGDVSACYEVCSRDDPRSEVLFYGRFDLVKNIFEFDNAKLAYLRKRTVKNIPHCEDCFCKYHCAGDCLTKSSNGKDLLNISNTTRCAINQALTLDSITANWKNR